MTKTPTERYNVTTADGVAHLRARQHGLRWHVTDIDRSELLGWLTSIQLDGRSMWKVYEQPRAGAFAECIAYDKTRRGAVMAIARHCADKRERSAK